MFLSHSIRNSMLDDICAAYQASPQPLTISLDGRWSSRRQAMEGTVTCFDAMTGKVIELQHIGMPRGDDHCSMSTVPFLIKAAVQDRTGELNEIMPRADDPRTSLYTGPSVSYESFGVQCISKRLKSRGIRVRDEFAAQDLCQLCGQLDTPFLV